MTKLKALGLIVISCVALRVFAAETVPAVAEDDQASTVPLEIPQVSEQENKPEGQE